MVRKFIQSFSPPRMKWIWRWIFLGILIGVVSGFGAILFNFLLQKGTLLLVFVKIFATSFTISSGGSGGVFAPSLFIGLMLGGFYGNVCSTLFPNLLMDPSAFVLVGMGGFLLVWQRFLLPL